MPLVSILVIYSAKTHTLPSITFGLKRYSFPFSAVNSAIAHPCLVTLTPSEEIALFVSLGVSTTSSLSLYAPRVCLILLTSLPTFTASSRETDLVVPFLFVISTTLSSVRFAFTFSAPAVAVSAALMALFVLSAAVLAALMDAVRALRSILSSLPLSEGDIKPALPGDIKGLLFSLSLNSELERDAFIGAVALGTTRYWCEPSANSILIAVSYG